MTNRGVQLDKAMHGQRRRYGKDLKKLPSSPQNWAAGRPDSGPFAIADGNKRAHLRFGSGQRQVRYPGAQIFDDLDRPEQLVESGSLQPESPIDIIVKGAFELDMHLCLTQLLENMTGFDISWEASAFLRVSSRSNTMLETMLIAGLPFAGCSYGVRTNTFYLPSMGYAEDHSHICTEEGLRCGAVRASSCSC